MMQHQQYRAATQQPQPANGAARYENAAGAATGYVPQPTLNSPARSSEVLALFVRLITLSLSLGLHDTAVFIAERYSCLCPASEEAVFYHSLALLRCGQDRLALETLKKAMVTDAAAAGMSASSSKRGQQQPKPAFEASLRCAWVYAEACMKLGRPHEGGEVLRRASLPHVSNSSKSGMLLSSFIATPTSLTDLNNSIEAEYTRASSNINTERLTSMHQSRSSKDGSTSE
jgi:hypothetical protein